MSEPRVVWGARQWLKKVEHSNREREYGETAAERVAQRARKSKAPPERREGNRAGVVAQVQNVRYLVLDDEGYLFCKWPSGTARRGAEPLVVGDRVTFDLREDGQGIIKGVLPRATELVRMRGERPRNPWRSRVEGQEDVLAANVDLAVIVASADAPPFHPRLIDRYLILCEYGGVSPLICLNKCDLVDTLPDLSVYERIEIPVVFTSAVTGDGLEELRGRLKGKYSVLTGHSGVGKSSLINKLLGEEILRVGEVNLQRGRGRHTTTTSSLHRLDDDTHIVDTPGIRSLSVWNVDRRDIRLYLPEFEEPSLRCKYRDCAHLAEPECGVRDAVERGEIPLDRYDSYVRLMEE